MIFKVNPAILGVSMVLRVTPALFGPFSTFLDQFFVSILANVGHFFTAFISRIWINESGAQ